MKTNVVMISNDRNLFGKIVKQETKTGMLCVSDLEDVAEIRNKLKNYSVKHIPELLTRKENRERIFYILEKQNVINVDISTFMELVENDGITRTLKKVGAWKTTGARNTKTTWCNPYIWMLLALELSPEIYGTAIVWLTDNLIINRIEAGNFYKGLTKAIQKFQNVDYVKLAKALNYIVFGKHETGIRNIANQKQLKELEEIEKQIAFNIDFGYITTFDQLINDLRRLYNIKYCKTIN